MREIQSITIITNQGVSTISVGDIINGLEVAEIQDRSLEWENFEEKVSKKIKEIVLKKKKEEFERLKRELEE